MKGKYEKVQYRVEFASTQSSATFVEKSPWKTTFEENFGYIALNDGLQQWRVMGFLASSGLEVRKVERQTASLEEIFMKVAGQA